MRSSKSRSRSKSNRPRSIGNIVNRVFDSSGPEGKVRGTPQQIIEKYQFLARDAQLSNDRVAAENFMQHAEHYTRMLAEAQRELAAEQDQRRPQGEYAQNGNQNGGYTGNQNGAQNPSFQNSQPQHQARDPQGRDRPYRDDRPAERDEQPEVAIPRGTGLMDFIDALDDSGLVETPEMRERPAAPARPDFNDRRDPRPEGTERQERRWQDRKPRPEARPDRPPVAEVPPVPAPPAPEPVTLAPEAEAAPPRRARAPRKPRAEEPLPEDGGPVKAAE